MNVKGYNDSIANIPGTSIHIYSVLMAVAIIAVVFSSWLKMYKRNIPTRTLEGSILIIVPIGLLGARFWYVLNDTSNIHSFVDVFAVWRGGLAIQGGVTTGFIVGLIIFYRASKKYRISMWVYLDCILPNILLGQAIGRWGNFFNQEVLGANIGHPFAFLPSWINNHLHYPNDPVAVYRQPLFLYESFCSVIGWVLLTFLIPKVGSFFSKKPWVIKSDIYVLPVEQKIKSIDYLLFWNLFKKLYYQHKFKKVCWEKEYYDFEPDEKDIKDLIVKKYKPLKIDVTMKLKQKIKIRTKNLLNKFFIKFHQDASLLNQSYNKENYKLTYAGVTGSCYFIFYGIIRAIMEPFRDSQDIMKINGVSTSVIFSILWVILGVSLLVFAQFIASKKFRKKGWFYEKQY